jgi:hypothetical protein
MLSLHFPPARYCGRREHRIFATFSLRPPQRTAQYAFGATSYGLTAGKAALPVRHAYGVPWSEGQESAALSTPSLRDPGENAG